MSGSLQNMLMTATKHHIPQVGEDVTECLYSDRNAWRVIEVSPRGKEATLARYTPVWTGRCYGDESYRYVDDSGKPLVDLANTITVRFRWRRWRYKDSNAEIKLAWGVREEYRDPSF